MYAWYVCVCIVRDRMYAYMRIPTNIHHTRARTHTHTHGYTHTHTNTHTHKHTHTNTRINTLYFTVTQKRKKKRIFDIFVSYVLHSYTLQ